MILEIGQAGIIRSMRYHKWGDRWICFF